MNADEMLDYVFHQLEGPALARAEAELAADPARAAAVDRLKRSVVNLVDDGDEFAPPPGLADRTIRFVETARVRRRTIYDFVPNLVPFRWADVAAVAGILVAGMMTLLPAVSRSRDTMAHAGCTYNLQQLGSALWLYGSRHHHYPYGPEVNPVSHAGNYIVSLTEENLIPDLSTLDCPCNGRCPDPRPAPRLRELFRLQKSDPNAYRAAVHSDYAYNISFRHPSGHVEPLEAVPSAVIPLLADEPDHVQFIVIRPGNSPNHGGRGQNVLYGDLHVGYHPTRKIGPKGDDIYLNDKGQLAPGTSVSDAVLCPSLVPFGGWATGTKDPR